jgi:hypothetical protein
MPSGLRIDLNDGGPVMEITAGLRARFSAAQPSRGITESLCRSTGTVRGIWLFLSRPKVSESFFDTGLFPFTQRLASVVQSGGTLTMNTQETERAPDTYQWPGQVWRITPASQAGNSGLLISDSTDFTVLTTNGNLGSCTWYGTVTINDSWTPLFQG